MRILLLSLSLVYGYAVAEELTITPGLWETTSTRTNPMGGDPVTRTMTNCVKESSWNPKAMMKELQGCELTRNDLAGNTLQFAMRCTMEGAETQVSGRYQIDGDAGNGDMKMAMSFGPMEMEISMQMQSRRIKDC